MAPSSDEIDALRRSGKYFGKHALTTEPVLVSRLLGDLLPDEREIRKLWDGAMRQSGAGGRDFAAGLFAKAVVCHAAECGHIRSVEAVDGGRNDAGMGRCRGDDCSGAYEDGCTSVSLI